MNLPTKSELDALDFSWVQHAFKECPERAFVDAPAGVEHYRLLYWFGLHIRALRSVELGTYMGFSAHCLGYMGGSRVLTYDINFGALKWHKKPDNIGIRIAPHEEYIPESIESADLIFVDTWHNGKMEMQVLDNLHFAKWKGILIYDDIHYNAAMEDFWNDAQASYSQGKKFIDATEIGHSTGTGIIIFE